eukprot:9122410-Alexandrium_andersonii.AAC.1
MATSGVSLRCPRLSLLPRHSTKSSNTTFMIREKVTTTSNNGVRSSVRTVPKGTNPCDLQSVGCERNTAAAAGLL